LIVHNPLIRVFSPVERAYTVRFLVPTVSMGRSNIRETAVPGWAIWSIIRHSPGPGVKTWVRNDGRGYVPILKNPQRVCRINGPFYILCFAVETRNRAGSSAETSRLLIRQGRLLLFFKGNLYFDGLTQVTSYAILMRLAGYLGAHLAQAPIKSETVRSYPPETNLTYPHTASITTSSAP